MSSYPDQNTDGREAPVTLITGTSRGIGRYLAEHYLGLGHRVVGCSRGSPDLPGEGYTHLQVDVRDEREVLGLFREVRGEFGRLDHLINNAGIASMNHALTTPVSTLQRVFETNVISTFLFSREAAKLMRKRRFGRIVNVSSVAVPLRLAGEAAYAASKGAVETLTGVLARDLAAFGITVNAVGPGPIETSLIRGVPEEHLKNLLNRFSIKEFSSFSDVANVTDFFFSRNSRMVTGEVIYLGGI